MIKTFKEESDIIQDFKRQHLRIQHDNGEILHNIHLLHSEIHIMKDEKIINSSVAEFNRNIGIFNNFSIKNENISEVFEQNYFFKFCNFDKNSSYKYAILVNMIKFVTIDLKSYFVIKKENIVTYGYDEDDNNAFYFNDLNLKESLDKTQIVLMKLDRSLKSPNDLVYENDLIDMSFNIYYSLDPSAEIEELKIKKNNKYYSGSLNIHSGSCSDENEVFNILESKINKLKKCFKQRNVIKN